MDPLRLRVATFNIRHNADRYLERKPILGVAFVALDVDFAGLQEVVFGDEQQHLYLASRPAGRPYSVFDARSGRNRDFGNAILARTGAVLAHEELSLSHGRVAHRILVLLPGNRTLWFANTHLHHIAAEPEVRQEQAEAYAAWLAGAPEADGIIAAGDFNAPPREACYGVMRDAGFRSAYLEANGAEPRLTRPSGIRPDPMDEEPACVDYLWVHGRVAVLAATLDAGNAPTWERALFPSDHLAVVAEVELP